MPSRRRRRGRSPSADLKMVRAIRGVTPALSACRRPFHRRLVESEKPTASPQRSPQTGTSTWQKVRLPLLLQNQSALFLEFSLVDLALGEPLLQNVQGA